MKIDGIEVHSDITEDYVCDMARECMFGMSNDGICIACGSEQGGCEPDAEKYICECCGEAAVYGAEQLMLYMVG